MLRLTDLIAEKRAEDPAGWRASIARVQQNRRRQLIDYARRHRLPNPVQSISREVVKERIIERPTFRQAPPPPPRQAPMQPTANPTAIYMPAIEEDDAASDV